MTAVSDTPVTRMRNIMELEALDSGTSADGVPERIAEQILEASTAEDVFDAAESGLEGAASVINMPLRLLSIAYNKSGYDGPLPVYTVVTSVDGDGIPHTWHIGGTTAQTQLFKWNQISAFPLIAVLVEWSTQSGNTVYRFRRPTPAERKIFDRLDVGK